MPRTWILLGTLIVLVFLAGTLVTGVVYLNNKWYNDGYVAATAKFERKIEAEKKRQEEILKKIESTFLDDLTKQERENELLEQALKMSEEEASKDPDSNKPALGIAGVRRLNKIR